MSNTSHPKSSGLDDFDLVLGNVNKKEELQDETEKLDRYLEHVHGALFRAEEVIKKADEQIGKADAAIARIETATGALERSAEKIEPALNSLADDISKDKRFKFTAQLDDKSIASVKAEHGEFIKDEKKLLEEHRKDLKKSIFLAVADQKQAFENHKIEMEREREYGDGIWLSKRAWNWAGGLLLVWGLWFVASVILLIVAHTT